MSGHRDGNAVAVDLDKMSVQQLTALIEAAEAKRREKHEEAKQARGEVPRSRDRRDLVGPRPAAALAGGEGGRGQAARGIRGGAGTGAAPVNGIRRWCGRQT